MVHAPGSYAEFGELTTVTEAKPGTAALDMIRELADDQMKVAAAAKDLVAGAEMDGDDASVDLGVRRMEVHQKNAWMLRSHLERS